MKEKLNKIYNIIMVIIITACITAIGIRLFDIKTERNIQEKINKQILEIMNNSSIDEKLGIKIQIIQQYLDKYYIGDINEDKCIESAVKGYVDGLGDEYTEFLTEEEYNELLITINGNYSGIGILMGQDKDGNVIILGTIKNSPAEKSEIKAGDIVLKVDGEDCIGKDLTLVSNKIKGEIGTKVKLELLRGEKVIEKTVTRQKIEINVIESKMLENNIGYIKIMSFDEETLEGFQSNYDQLIENGAESIIIDLRNNGGGLVNVATEMVDLFLPKNSVIMKSIDKDNNEMITKASNIKKNNIKVVVLTNENSASASEIFVAALKDNNFAKIVGTKTFGKGIVQELVQIKNIGYMKITIEEFLTPNGDKINKNGIAPDYEIENIKDSDEDLQLKKAIEVIKEI